MIDPEYIERAFGALGDIEELAVRRKMDVGCPDVAVEIPRRRPALWHTAWHARNQRATGRKAGHRAHFRHETRLRVEREGEDRAGHLAQHVEKAIVSGDIEVPGPRARR